MFIPDPDLLPSQISDPGSNKNKKVGKTVFCPTFSWSHKFHTIVKYFIFEKVPKILSQTTNNLSFCNPKIVTKLSEIWNWDPRFWIWKKTHPGSRILDPGVKKAPDPESGAETQVKSVLMSPLGKFKLCLPAIPTPMVLWAVKSCELLLGLLLPATVVKNKVIIVVDLAPNGYLSM